MLIQKIEIKNFGPIQELSVSTENSGVVGLLGPNGKGKSHVLHALSFAFTGSLDLSPRERYIHRYGLSDDSPKSASIRVTFVQNGKTGTIFRQIGSGSKQTLEWEGNADGKPIKAAKEIDAKLAEILGADKRAMENAVFISQGQVDKLVSTKDRTEREDALLRLLGLSYLPIRTDNLHAHILKMRENIVDYAPAMDVAKETYNKAEADYISVTAEYNDLPDPKPMQDILDRGKTTFAKMRLLEQEQSDLRTAVATCEESKNALLAQYGTPVESEFLSKESELHEAANKANTAYNTAEMRVRYVREYYATQGRKNELQEHVHACEKKYEEISAYRVEEVDVEKLQAMEAQLPIRQKYEYLQEEYTRCADTYRQTLLTSCEYKRENLPKIAAWEAEEVQHQQNIQDSTEDLTRLQDKKKLAIILRENQKDACNCPLCQSQLTGSLLEVIGTPESWESKILETEARIQEWRRVAVSAKSSKEFATREISNIDYRVSQQQEIGTGIQKKIKDIESQGNVPSETSQDISEVIRGLKNQQSLHRQWYAKHQESSAELASAKQRLEDCLSTLSRMEVPTETQEEISSILEKARSAMDAAKLKLQHYANSFLQPWKNWNQRQIASRERQSAASAEMESLRNQREQEGSLLITAAEKHTALKDVLAEMQVSGEENAVMALRELDRNRAEMKGNLQTLQATLVESMNRIAEIQRKIEMDAHERLIMEELTKARETLLRAALPMTYLQYRFEEIVALTQDQLSQTDANFCVTADPERPASFLFTRTDDDSGYVMRQDQLSGGQKIRLSIALLMAVQKILLPEVRFLVLDEPSVHVDREGVESLADMLSALGSRLMMSESQLFVCDHVPELERAFQSVIRLGA